MFGSRREATAATLSVALILGPSGLCALSESPGQAPTPIVRITTEIVQVDAVVTDRSGHRVTDLIASDFEIREDGRRRVVTHCSYVDLGVGPPPGATPAPLLATERAASPERIRRTMAFVVDDLSLSFESTVHTRHLLTTFVDEQMQAGDAVAIIRVSAGMGALQQFTADKRLLHAAIKAVRFNLSGRLSSAFDMLPLATNGVTGGALGDPMRAAAARLEELSQRGERQRANLSTVGTLGALHFILRGLQDLPGRKSIVLVSENLSLDEELGREGPVRSSSLTEDLRRTTDAANRSAVVIYALDPTGLQPGPLGVGFAGRLDAARAGLSMLAQDTGGLLLADTNDLSGAVARVVEDQRGYYLIGYEPDEATFTTAGGRDYYHSINIRVKRPGLKVRSRAGFYSRPDSEATHPSTPDAQVLAAVMSPFVSPDVRLRLTPLFGYELKRGSYLRTLLHVDAKDLTFARLPDGMQEDGVRLSAIAFDTAGRIVGQTHRDDWFTVTAANFGQVQHDGFVYVLDMPIAKGAYQVRAAVRDEGSGRTGSASQFVEVPDVSKGRLALSGIILTQAGGDETTVTDVNGASAGETRMSPAVRRFAQGSALSYSCFAYNPRVDPKTRTAALDLALEIFREGTVVETLAPRRIEGVTTDAVSVQAVAGTFHLPPDAGPGSYTLNVTVRDSLRKKAVARQWIDFEVAESQTASPETTRSDAP